MTPRSAKAKGRRLVQAIAADVLRAFPNLDAADVRVPPTSVPGSDLWLSAAAQQRFPFALEAKNREALSIWSAIKQAQQAAAVSGLTPLVVLKRNHGRVWALLPWPRLLKLVVAAAQPPVAARPLPRPPASEPPLRNGQWCAVPLDDVADGLEELTGEPALPAFPNGTTLAESDLPDDLLDVPDAEGD